MKELLKLFKFLAFNNIHMIKDLRDVYKLVINFFTYYRWI